MNIPILLVILVSLKQVTQCQDYRNTSDLLKELLQGYNKDLRPRKNLSSVVNVHFDCLPRFIEEVDVINHQLILRFSVLFQWQDEYLRWKKSTYDIDSLRFHTSSIWIPDIVVQNNVDHVTHLGSDKLKVTVSHTGSASLYIEVKEAITCTFDVFNFPFDEQNCSLILGSDNYLKWELNTTSFRAFIKPEMYEPSGEWLLTDFTPGDSSVLSKTFNVSFNSVTLSLRRYPMFYVINLIIPIMLISLLNPFVFLVTSDSGEKLSLSVTLFLSFTVFITMFSGMLPRTAGGTVLISVYVCSHFILSGIILIICVLLQRLCHQQENGSFSLKPNTITCCCKTSPVIFPKEGKVEGIQNAPKRTPKDVAENISRKLFYIIFVTSLISTAATVGRITM